MKFFSKKPRRRLFFVFVYAVLAVCLIINNFSWFNILSSIIMVFCGYIAVVKAKIIKDKNANAIDDSKFDFYSILLIVVFLIDVISQVT